MIGHRNTQKDTDILSKPPVGGKNYHISKMHETVHVNTEYMYPKSCHSPQAIESGQFPPEIDPSKKSC